MALQQGFINPLDIDLTLEDLTISTITGTPYPITRVIHNGTNIITYEQSTNLLRFFDTDGDRGPVFSLTSGVYDIANNSQLDLYYQLRPGVSGGLRIDRINQEGTFLSTVVDWLDFPGVDNSSRFIVNELAVPSGSAFIKVQDRIYTVELDPTNYVPGTPYDESDSNISLFSGVIPSSASNLLYSREQTPNLPEYLLYRVDDQRLNTLSAQSNAVAQSPDKVFIEQNISEAGSDIHFFHGDDHNTLYTLQFDLPVRANLPGTLIASGVGTEFEAVTRLEDPLGPNFYFTETGLATTVASGDLLRVVTNSGTDEYLLILDTAVESGVYTFGPPEVTRVTTSSLASSVLAYSGTSSSGVFNFYENTLASEGANRILSYDLSNDRSAFTAVNVDDFSLRVDTSDAADVTAEVISAWGEPLEDKTVEFSISTGDGVISPLVSATNAQGQVTVSYQVGSVSGIVTILAEVED